MSISYNFQINAGIIRDLTRAIARNCPKAFIAIITNPVNSTVPVAAEVLKKAGVYDPKRLFGVSTLDIVRAETFIGELKGVDPTTVKVDVVGGHSADTMLPVLSKVPNSKTFKSLIHQVGLDFTPDQVKSLNERISEAGTVVVNAKAGAGSATLSMAHAAARFTASLVAAKSGTSVREVSYVDVSSMGLSVAYCGVPIEINSDGISKLLPLPDLSADEKAVWEKLVPILKQNIDTGNAFAQKQ